MSPIIGTFSSLSSRAFAFNAFFRRINKPSITSPTQNQTLNTRTPTLTASAFSGFGIGTIHISTDWQVASNSNFSTIVWESLNDSTNKTSITTGDLGGNTRYVRVRYRTLSNVVSDWSDTITFTSPWATGGGGTQVSPTTFELGSSGTINLSAGTYRITIWGAGGGGAAGGANGCDDGGGAGSVSKDVAYTSSTNVSFTIASGGTGAYGSADARVNVPGIGGSPGGGNGSNTIYWNGGGGGGYSETLGMRAAGGGGAAGDGVGNGGGGGSGNGAGGVGGGGSGSPGSGGGGGGGGANGAGSPIVPGSNGNGGSNSGSYSSTYSTSNRFAANRYYSSTESRYFGDGGVCTGNGQPGGAIIQTIASQNVPNVVIVSNIPTTVNETAGNQPGGYTFVATDTANGDSTVTYQWYMSTNGGSSYSALTGENTNSLSDAIINPIYYSDNGRKFFCRATVTNSAGTRSVDSNISTLNVSRNYDCNGPTVTGNIKIMNAGLHDNSYTWVSWSPGFSDICEINGNTNSFNAGGRCNFCKLSGVQQGWEMELELRIVKPDGTRVHYGNQYNSSTGCDSGGSRSYQLYSNGGYWDFINDGVPTFQLGLNYARCRNGVPGDIGQQTFNDVYLNYSYKRAQFFYETRP